MKKSLFPSYLAALFLVLGICGGLTAAAQSADSPRQKILFDRDWRFHLGDAQGADAPAFDDSAWRTLDIPHDWMIEGVKGADPAAMDGPFDKNSPAKNGGAYMDGGIGWYRKTFKLPAAMQGKVITLLFDGAYMNADVWLNGQHIGTHPYGFTSFYYDITNSLKYGGETNTLAVKLDVEQPSCRWYSGAGLYRDVWLVETQPVHAAMWSTYVTTPQVSAESAQVQVSSTVENDGASAEKVTIRTTLYDPSGREVTSAAKQQEQIGAKSKVTVTEQVALPRPLLWSLNKPALYTAVTRISNAAGEQDIVQTPFGVRTFKFTVDKGFFLNGEHVNIQGVCDHHDLGALGAAVYTRGLERQLEILKSMGCNAIRTSHNPPAPALLDLCDKMGFLVMDEAFDEWKQNKRQFGYGQFFDQWSEPDLVSMLDRDRNHPSIILWSIGNEIEEGSHGNPVAGPIAQRLVAICKREDPTRPTVSACPAPAKDWSSGLAQALDVFGVNYNLPFYATNSPESRANAGNNAGHYSGQLPMIASESQSQVDTRGEYGISLDAQGNVQINQKANYQVSSYDGFVTSWANSPDDQFIAMDKSPWVGGEFVWTGFDYLGEPTPYGWPSRSSYFGIVDLCGFPKDRYYQFQERWTNQSVVHMLPHWTWPGFEGKTIPVMATTNADTVELFLNGKSLGVQHYPADCIEMTGKKGEKKPSLHLQWNVPYAPGEIKAVASKNGHVVATDIERTAGAPARIVAVADRSAIEAGGRDLSFIKVSIVDKNGIVVPDAAPELSFAVSGDAATVAGLDNGDPTNHEFFQGTQHKAFHGLALAILKSAKSAGCATLTISGDNLAPATVALKVNPSDSPVLEHEL
jgi:beta-galactosidase